MSETTLLSRLAEFITSYRSHSLPEEVRVDAGRRIRDVLGNSLAAADTEPARITSALGHQMGGTPESTMLVDGVRVPASTAALVNGTLAHALDFDDTHLPSVLHPSASIVPAALAVAEAGDKTGSDLCTAVALGNEVCIRLGMAGFDADLGNSVYFEHGLHATSICGTVGAASAVASLLGLDATVTGHAIAIAASMGAGLLEANRTGGSVKQVHCGWAAHAGLMAASLARLGLSGPPTVFEGRFGFLQAYLREQAHPEAIVAQLGEHWTVTETFFKPYPSNHFTHAVIDCSLELRKQIPPEALEAVEIGVAAPTLRTIAEPADRKARPKTGYEAKFSGAYAFAAAFIGGGGLGVHIDDFTDEAVTDRRRQELAARVKFVSDPECSSIYPWHFPAIARVSLRDGGQREVKVLVNRGSPQNPLTESELREKFLLNASRHLTAERAQALDEAVEALDERSVRTMVALSAAGSA